MLYAAQLALDEAKYARMLKQEMSSLVEAEAPYKQLQSIKEPSILNAIGEVVDVANGVRMTLIHQRASPEEPIEELILSIQGYLVEANLPPIRKMDVPRSNHRIIGLSQSVVISGLGEGLFQDAVQVQYWERTMKESKATYTKIKPHQINISNLVSYRSLSQWFAFPDRNRTVEKDFNLASIAALTKRAKSPRRPLKRKVGYGDSEEDDTDSVLKRMRLDDSDLQDSAVVSQTDVPMAG
ncbi:uncharacterized protein BXZ73DRAFT_98784 [Epithele typhae]|uniref:uncharacterized protein n=1 Tax=Epithele typhae TaxID=378194 RepID=UPI00200848E3|nr:uncharacterized protein BXZ73DRAFT_98784 [Epithele typhae]KAH9940344.1 hypothetical protein BXZ73DRAFT_98784 [Epithele typhae]